MAEIIKLILLFFFISILIPLIFIIRIWIKFRKKYSVQRDSIKKIMEEFKRQSENFKPESAKKKSKKAEQKVEKVKAEDAQYREVN